MKSLRTAVIRHWSTGHGAGRVAAVLFEFEAPASGVGWECQPTNHTGDRHEATRKFGHGDAHRRPRGLARTDFEPRSSVTSRPFRTLHRASGLRGFCAWARSHFSNDAAESRVGTGHAGSGSAPVRSSLGQGLARIHSRTRSRRAFASATSEADGAFNQSRNQVRRVMSGGLRFGGLCTDIALEYVRAQERQVQPPCLGNSLDSPFADRGRLDLAHARYHGRSSELVDQFRVGMLGWGPSVHGRSIGAPNSQMQGPPFRRFVRLS